MKASRMILLGAAVLMGRNHATQIIEANKDDKLVQTYKKALPNILAVYRNYAKLMRHDLVADQKTVQPENKSSLSRKSQLSEQGRSTAKKTIQFAITPEEAEAQEALAQGRITERKATGRKVTGRMGTIKKKKKHQVRTHIETKPTETK